MNTEDKAENLFFEADELINENKIVEAKELLIEILSEFPDYGYAHNHLGWIYQVKFSDYEKAEKHLKLAMKYAPNYNAGYVNFAYLLLDINKYDEMIKFGEEALSHNFVDKSTIYNKMAQAYEMKDDNFKAYDYYKLAVKHTLNNTTLEQIYSSINRIKDKMSFIQKLKLIVK
ncbi:MAG: hypothetical protein R2821_11585 [Flavobacteriaceae bacterium]|jgi:tetratricopeptide (TPR) repeat protein